MTCFKRTSDVLSRLAALILLTVCFVQAAGAYGTPRRHVSRRPLSLDVPPSPEIEAQVSGAVELASHILDDLNTENLLTSGYLVSAIYYHDDFLRDFPVDRDNAAPERHIIGQISKMLSAEQKAHFIRLLHEIWARTDPADPERSAEPVAYKAIGGARNHKYAIDLFALEGAAVRTVSRGVVILADGGWDPANLFSTTSRKGGNTVIVFDPDHDRFYRYCHMSAVQVSPGQLVASSDIVGSVGHTGLNASQPGHGRHLHLEINEFLSGHVRAIEYRQLRSMVRQWRSSSNAGAGNKEGVTSRTKAPSGQTLSKR